MTKSHESRHSWSVWFATAVVVLPIIYFLVSGPVRGYGDQWGVSHYRFNQFFAPLVWLEENTIAERPIALYWGLFPHPYEHESDFLTRFLKSPKARSNSRNLGYE